MSNAQERAHDGRVLPSCSAGMRGDHCVFTRLSRNCNHAVCSLNVDFEYEREKSLQTHDEARAPRCQRRRASFSRCAPVPLCAPADSGWHIEVSLGTEAVGGPDGATGLGAAVCMVSSLARALLALSGADHGATSRCWSSSADRGLGDETVRESTESVSLCEVARRRGAQHIMRRSWKHGSAQSYHSFARYTTLSSCRGPAFPVKTASAFKHLLGEYVSYGVLPARIAYSPGGGARRNGANAER